MKTFLKQNCAVFSCLIATNAAVAQGFDIEGTDYYEAKSTSQIWLEDASNLYIEMAKSFACVISDSRPEITANGIGRACSAKRSAGWPMMEVLRA